MNKLTPDVPGKIAFNPERIGSIVPALQEQQQRDQAAAQRYIQSVNQNFETLKGNAKHQETAIKNWSDDMQSLTKFSQSLLNEFTEYQKQRNTAEMEEGIAAAYEQGIDIDTSNMFEDAEESQRADDAVSQEAGGAAFEQTNSYETASRVKAMSGWKAYGYSVGRAQMAGNAYGPWMRDAMENDNETIITIDGKSFTPATARTAAETQAAMAVLRRKFINSFGLSGASAAVLNKYAFPQMHKYDSQIQFERRNLFDKETAFEETQTAFRTFHATKDLNQLFSQLRNVRGEDGKLLGKSGAHARIKKFLTESIQDGLLSVDELRAIGEQEVSWAPGKKFGTHYRNLIEGAIRDARQVERAEESYQRQEKRRVAQEKINAITAEIYSNSGLYSKEDLETLIREIKSDPDLVSVNTSALEDAARSETSDAQVIEQQRGRLEALASSGLLRPHHLNGVPFQVRQQFESIAQAQAKAAGPQGNYQKEMQYIKGTVTKHRGEINGDGSVSIPTGAIITELQQRFRSQVANDINNGVAPEQAVRNALVEVENYFQQEATNTNGRYYKQEGKDNYMEILSRDSVSSQFQSTTRIFDDRAEYFPIDDVIASGEFLKQAELEQNELLWGTPEWRLPGLVQHIVDTYPGRDPLVTLNQFRAAQGMPPLESPAAAAAAGMTPQGQNLLNRWRSSMRTTRAYASEVQSWDPTRHKYGPQIDIASQQSGVASPLIAALAEIESSNDPNSVSPTGAIGLMQIMPDSHPNYTGGFDPQQNLTYGAAYFGQLLQKYGGNTDHAVAAYNMGPNAFDAYLAGRIPMPEETKEHVKKFNIALSKYQPNLNNQATMRGQFEVVQLVTTDPRTQNDDEPSTVYDPAGHGGDNMHQHYEFATKEQAALAKKLFEKRGFRVTSYLRSNDSGSAHQHGYAIDVAPPLNLPRTDEAEMAWIDKANAVIGY